MSSLIPYARIVAIAALAGIAQAQNASQAANSIDFFETKVRPVLASNCFSCHTSNKMGGLRLDSQEAIIQGGKSGPAVVPGDPEKSLLMQLVRHADAKKRMPMGSKLKDGEIAALESWVKAGAV